MRHKINFDAPDDHNDIMSSIKNIACVIWVVEFEN